MRNLALASFAAAALLAPLPASAQQGPATVYSDKVMSADELEDLFGLQGAGPPQRGEAKPRVRAPTIDFGTAPEPATAPMQGAADTPARRPAVSPRSLSVPIQFELNSDTVAPQFRQHLAGLSELLKRHSEMVLLVIGHTDSTGGAQLNQNLSERRAKAVRRLLIASGVPSAQVVALGHGSSRPLPGEPKASSRQRRVEFMPAGDV